MRTINAKDIENKLEKVIYDTATTLAKDAVDGISKALAKEDSERAKFAMNVLLENAEVAKKEAVPLCQDTGMAVFFVELGQDVHIEGSLKEALNRATSKAYSSGLRSSVLDPLSRINTKDNTPAIIHINLVEGDGLKISFMPKGFGAENMTKLYMLFPSAGKQGIINSVVDAAKNAGACPCPPYVIGVGIGGTSEKALEMAKHGLLREIGSTNPDPELAELEKSIKDAVNALHIGASGFGGNTTALAVHIEKHPTHIAGLPVAINFGCNAMRKAEVIF
jgi:fumarate hydratase subunit alpha